MAPQYPTMPGSYPGQPAPKQNGLGVTSLVLGLVGIPLTFLCFVGVICSLLAVIFGAIGLNKVSKGQADNRGVTVAGLILGIVGLLVEVGAVVLIIIAAAGSSST